MRILFISNRYKRGELERGPNYGYYNFYDGLTKMHNQENQVIFFGVDEALIAENEDQSKVKERLFQLIAKERPRLIFFLEGELSKETLKEMKREAENIGAKTLWWVSDDSWMFDRLSKKIAPYFHWVVSCDSKSFARHVKMGHKNVIHSQYACNNFYYQPVPDPKIYEVSFVGQPHGVRKRMINELEKSGIKVNCWGFGWPAGVLPQADLPKVFSQSKINLNFNAPGGAFWKKAASLFLKRKGERKSRRLVLEKPWDWKDNFLSFWNSLRWQLHCRPFEVLGCRGFLLTDDADNLRDYYEDGKELVIFKDVKDLVKKIKHYLAHDQERERIAQAGYERTLKDHTYEKRFDEIFKIMGFKNDK